MSSAKPLPGLSTSEDSEANSAWDISQSVLDAALQDVSLQIEHTEHTTKSEIADKSKNSIDNNTKTDENVHKNADSKVIYAEAIPSTVALNITPLNKSPIKSTNHDANLPTPKMPTASPVRLSASVQSQISQSEQKSQSSGISQSSQLQLQPQSQLQSQPSQKTASPQQRTSFSNFPLKNPFTNTKFGRTLSSTFKNTFNRRQSSMTLKIDPTAKIVGSVQQRDEDDLNATIDLRNWVSDEKITLFNVHEIQRLTPSSSKGILFERILALTDGYVIVLQSTDQIDQSAKNEVLVESTHRRTFSRDSVTSVNELENEENEKESQLSITTLLPSSTDKVSPSKPKISQNNLGFVFNSPFALLKQKYRINDLMRVTSKKDRPCLLTFHWNIKSQISPLNISQQNENGQKIHKILYMCDQPTRILSHIKKLHTQAKKQRKELESNMSKNDNFVKTVEFDDSKQPMLDSDKNQSQTKSISSPTTEEPFVTTDFSSSADLRQSVSAVSTSFVPPSAPGNVFSIDLDSGEIDDLP